MRVRSANENCTFHIFVEMSHGTLAIPAQVKQLISRRLIITVIIVIAKLLQYICTVTLFCINTSHIDFSVLLLAFYAYKRVKK
jgi:hypothetical protein